MKFNGKSKVAKQSKVTEITIVVNVRVGDCRGGGGAMNRHPAYLRNFYRGSELVRTTKSGIKKLYFQC